ncbi:MAG: aminotransferase class V-fold PLP-dependent enzyme [Anaerolineales bacterium]|nr:aminotransferase class V-fold PLP-dependent enzyme [Anaerolineales bacterium]
MKEHYLLDPDIIFLNHGSFGATPREVMEVCQEWQNQLERQPVHFLNHVLIPELKKARKALGDYLNADADDLIYIPNATVGVNIVVRSLALQPGDEVLTSDHEYGACENVWNFAGRTTGAKLVKQAMPLPIGSPEEVADQLWQGVTLRTKVIFLSQITSPTAVRMPVEIVCQRAREAGILTVIDGAHAPGQIPVDLKAMDPDFYTGNCHKWMQSPKVAGFLYTRKDLQPRVDPLVVSWGWAGNFSLKSGSQYLDYFEWPGTNDPSAYLSVPAAIAFQEFHDWETVRVKSRQLLAKTIEKINAVTGLEEVYTPHAAPFVQMAVVRIPKVREIATFQDALKQQYRIEVPCIEWNGQHFIRISVQAYNSADDLNTLVAAVSHLLPDHNA